jgi:DNA-binding CsgD family transcriptional regulator
MDKSGQLIDQIYGAALDGGAWPVALQTFQELFACNSVGLYSVNLQQPGAALVAMRDIEEDWIDRYVEQFLYDNPWMRVPEYQVPGRVRTDRSLDEHYRQPGYYHGTALYNEWMKPQDFIYSLGCNLLQDRQLLTKFYLYRGRRAGPFSPQDISRCQQLCAHMMRATRLARRLALQETRLDQYRHLLDRLDMGVVLLDGQGRVTQANAFAQALFRQCDGLHTRGKVLQAGHRDDQRQLNLAIADALELCDGRTLAPPRATSVRRADGKRPLTVLPMPLPRSDNPFLIDPAVVALLITDPEHEPMLPADWLRSRYGLTATEARLVQQLSRGGNLRHVAEQAGLTYETARWYLKGIFQKTGTSRQAALLHLVLSERGTAGYN